VHAQFVLFFFCLPLVPLRAHTLYLSDGKFDRSENLPQCTQVEYMLARATAVGIGYAAFRNPIALITIIDDLEAWCDSRGIKKVTELIGAVRDEDCATVRMVRCRGIKRFHRFAVGGTSRASIVVFEIP
jgi:hypothetical protein